MQTKTRSIDLSLQDGRAYTITIGSNLFARIAAAAPAHSVLISNPTIMNHYRAAITSELDAANKSYETLIIPDGEQHKNMQTINDILDKMVAAQIKRDSGIIAFGGGVVGDIAGFAAAIYMRGIALIQIPTTLLAQVDSAIGGKTGVNHDGGKNLIGSFYQPQSVWCDGSVLATLSEREFNAGLAEVVKYGLLGGAQKASATAENMGDFFTWLEEHQAAIIARDNETLTEMIYQSALCKANTVMTDERETSNHRALLNLGHTFAHAIETVQHYQGWMHGEAVAYGLVAAATLSETLCGLDASVTTRTKNLLANFNLPTQLPPNLAADDIIAAMKLDKKHTHQQQNFILLRALGDAHLHPITTDTPIRQTLATTG